MQCPRSSSRVSARRCGPFRNRASVPYPVSIPIRVPRAGVYREGISGIFNWYWTYIAIATRMADGIRRSNREGHLVNNAIGSCGEAKSRHLRSPLWPDCGRRSGEDVGKGSTWLS